MQHNHKFVQNKSAVFVIPEQGMSLGYWMSKQDKPVKMPVIVKENDDKHKRRIKQIIENMICPEPSDRYSMKFVNSYLQICEGKNYINFFFLLIISWSDGAQRFCSLFCLIVQLVEAMILD